MEIKETIKKLSDSSQSNNSNDSKLSNQETITV